MKHILIDYENIQPKSFDNVEVAQCHIWLFLGVNQQKSLPLELVETLLRFDNESVHIIKMQHAGKNALDFYLSFYLGKISEIDPSADVCILARDSGYDILVEHLNSAYNGMNIMRLENANQLNVAYEPNENTVLDIEQSKLVIDDNQDTLCDNVPEVLKENKKHLAQPIENDVPKVIIYDCYVLVFDGIVNRKVFLPSYKSNLLHLMKKYVPVKMLENFNNLEQDYIFEQVFDKFVKLGLISHNQNEEKLSYKVDRQGILDLVKDQVLLNKAKKIDGLNNVIKQKLATYRQVNDEKQVGLVVRWLEKQVYIKQNNQAIYYSPFDNIKENSSKVSQGNNKNSKDSATTYQRAIAQLKSRPASTRPSKKSSLINYLKSHLRNEDPKTIDKLVKQMVNNKIIVISNTNKLIYKI
ncbi:PIN domain-containing protein [Psychrobacter sp. AOP7-B1-25]|uniref:PIN domain-containing protein n=1 Tax=Psychrobacter sp. AOP7-B1-25 TaxID=3457644 RepID=UPI00402B0F2F